MRHHILAALLSLALALTLAAAPALADPLTVDLDTATIEQLQAAQSAIAERINALRAEQASTGDAIHHEGSGTSILSGIDVAAIPARVKITSTADTTVTLTGGRWDQKFDGSLPIESYITQAALYDALVETAGDWTLDIEPIVPGGSISISGTGAYVSDFFPLPSASIVTVTADPSKMAGYLTHFSVQFCHQYEGSEKWDYDSVTSELLSPDDPAYTADIIVKPTKDKQDYFWAVTCAPDVSWTITLK